MSIYIYRSISISISPLKEPFKGNLGLPIEFDFLNSKPFGKTRPARAAARPGAGLGRGLLGGAPSVLGPLDRFRAPLKGAGVDRRQGLRMYPSKNSRTCRFHNLEVLSPECPYGKRPPSLGSIFRPLIFGNSHVRQGTCYGLLGATMSP